MSKPYYKDEFVTLYCGDAREVLLSEDMDKHDSLITDPVWPNALPELAGSDDPYSLLSEVLKIGSRYVCRIVIQLGCLSDPRILEAVPCSHPFLRLCSLEYALPSRQGRFLNGGDVAYIFGVVPPPRPGAQLLPGKNVHASATLRTEGHPCPRRLSHVRFLVSFFGGVSVLDPFAGSGTTGMACQELGVRCTLIEIEERYCEVAAKRLSKGQLYLREGDECGALNG